jgi:hypothetical protein
LCCWVVLLNPASGYVNGCMQEAFRGVRQLFIYIFLFEEEYDVSELPRRKFSLASGLRTRARRPLRVFAAGNLLHGVQFFGPIVVAGRHLTGGGKSAFLHLFTQEMAVE